MNITSRQNAVVKQFRSGADGVFPVEGHKLISEALNAGFVPTVSLFTAKASEKYPALFSEISKLCPVSVISSDISEYISDTKTPQGIFGLFARKNNPLDFALCRRLILLDGVRDPGNAGAIARSCEAFGFDGAVFSEDSADIFGGKAVRASAGSAFRLPSYRGSLPDMIPELKKAGFFIYTTAADTDGNAVSAREAAFAEKSGFVIGSEGEGVSPEVSALCDGKIYIPIKGAESLNASVAAGILCYVMGK